ncbi:membrane protein [Arthrobacter phage KBurrousTX]|uniref:Membrane protein n=1 Tax=Arthrobacter phage KBurrousTX TaxID=2315608 RepID=A0A386KB20_9CAUD|nr:membrane protein [Arthrobacter phage KBurrousTX]AYD81524.1 membrane protein [Arthrobacter phage KBurrousTX]
MKKEIGVGVGVMMLAAITFMFTEHTTVTVVLLVILASSLAVLTYYYMRRARWQHYPAGRVFLYLIWSFDSLIIFLLFSRLVDSREVRITVYNVLIAGLIAAIWLITGTFWKAQRRARLERLRKAALNEKEENQP